MSYPNGYTNHPYEMPVGYPYQQVYQSHAYAPASPHGYMPHPPQGYLPHGAEGFDPEAETLGRASPFLAEAEFGDGARGYDQEPYYGLEGSYTRPEGTHPAPPHPGMAASRTVYLGNIPPLLHPHELLDYVRSGVIESVKILPEKQCAFLSFVDSQSALLFHSDAILKRLSIKNHDIRIGWGKQSLIQPVVMNAITRDGATRNVYLGNLGPEVLEAMLHIDLSKYGAIDTIKLIPEKGIAFVHFLSIINAVRCVQHLPLVEQYADKKIFYGKDRCAFITKTQQHNAAQYLGLAPGMEHLVLSADREFISNALVQQSVAAAAIATSAGGANNLGNRTVYLGNLHQDSTVEEICNVVRGGLLQSIRLLAERHICFITFVDPVSAAQFYAMCVLHGLTIHNRKIKIGWGKHLGSLPQALTLAVSNGASRNIYIGNLSDFSTFSAEKLRADFGAFGPMEQINFLREKNCAFVNFVNIADAIKAIDGVRSLAGYGLLKINFGKDRCGNLPRLFQLDGASQSGVYAVPTAYSLEGGVEGGYSMEGLSEETFAEEGFVDESFSADPLSFLRTGLS